MKQNNDTLVILRDGYSSFENFKKIELESLRSLVASKYTNIIVFFVIKRHIKGAIKHRDSRAQILTHTAVGITKSRFLFSVKGKQRDYSYIILKGVQYSPEALVGLIAAQCMLHFYVNLSNNADAIN